MLKKRLVTERKIHIAVSLILMLTLCIGLVGCGKEYKDGEKDSKPMTSSQMVDEYNNKYSKVRDFIKDNLEKQKTTVGKPGKVDEINFSDPTVKGNKKPNSLYYQNIMPVDNYNCSYCLEAKGLYGKDQDAEEIKSSLEMMIDKSKFDPKKFKVSGTLFEKYLRLVSTEKIDLKELDEKISQMFGKDSAIEGRYGNTKVSIVLNDDKVSCEVEIR